MKKLLLTLLLCLFSYPLSAKAEETTYERIIRTGEIRCGYYTWPPYFSKNLNTNHFEGLAYDYTEALAKSLNLKVQWSLD